MHVIYFLTIALNIVDVLKPVYYIIAVMTVGSVRLFHVSFMFDCEW